MVWWPCLLFTVWVTLVGGSSSIQENDVESSGKIQEELKYDFLQRAKEELDKDLMERTLNGATSSKTKKARHTKMWAARKSSSQIDNWSSQLKLKCQIPYFFCRSRAMSYRNALLRKGLKVLSSEGIEGEKAIKMANKALNNHHQSFRQLSRSKGHLLNLL